MGAGATHLIEQLAGNGTKARPKAKLTSEVESMGATLDVSAGREQSSYTMSLFNKDVKQGIDILADLVMAPGLSNLAKEKQAILRKLEDTPVSTREVIDDRLHQCAFRDYALGFPITGPFDSIENVTEAHLQAYLDTNYVAENMVIAASGAVKHEDIVAAAQAKFGAVKAGGPKEYGTKPYFCGADLLYRNDEMGATAYVAIGWEAVPWRSPDAITFMVMKHVIGSYNKAAGLVPGNISGNRVINAVANKMQVGCADEFETFMNFYKDTGMFGFYVAADEVAVEHAVGELMFGTNLLSFSVTDEEVERAKRELKASLFSAPTSSAASCATLGQEILSYGRGLPAAELMFRIDGVDAHEVKRVAWKYLNDAEIAITGLGPLHGLPSYYELRRMNTMHRY